MSSTSRFARRVREANQSAVELERTAARMAANTDRVAELTARIAAGGDGAWSRRGSSFACWRVSWRRSGVFWRSATAEATGSREAAQAQQQRAQEAVRAVAAAEQQAEQNRRGGDAVDAARGGRAGMSRRRLRRRWRGWSASRSGWWRSRMRRGGSWRSWACSAGRWRCTFGDVTERLKRAGGGDCRAAAEDRGGAASRRLATKRRGRPVARGAGDAEGTAELAGRADSRA